VEQVHLVEITHLVLVDPEHLHHLVLIARRQQVHQVLLEHQVPVVQVLVARNAEVLAEHLVKMQVKIVRENQKVEKLCVMSSTICKHRNWVAQLYLTVMERLRFACAVELHLQILPKKLMQILQL
jgi:hypothetical protein